MDPRPVPVCLHNAALLLVDWQLFFVSPASPAFLSEAVKAEGAVRALVDAFLSTGRRVIATRHGHPRGERGPFFDFYGRLLYSEDPLSKLALFLRERESIRTVPKRTYSVFASSDLATDLRTEGITALVLAGLQTDRCVAANALAAFDLGLSVVVAADACAARTCERHLAALRLLEWSCATIVSTGQIIEALS